MILHRQGELKHIKNLKFWDLASVLTEKYKIDEAEAREFAAFLLPMLDFNPLRRATASDLLAHAWLATPDKPQ